MEGARPYTWYFASGNDTVLLGYQSEGNVAHGQAILGYTGLCTSQRQVRPPRLAMASVNSFY